MDDLKALLILADAYQAAGGLKETRVSWRVFGDTKKLKALRSGRDIQHRRLVEALRWFAENWPDNTPWPKDVSRKSLDEVAA